jgi:hypothetical protein
MCRSSCLKACKTITETTRKQTRKEKIFIKEEIRHSFFSATELEIQQRFLQKPRRIIRDSRFEI